MHEHSGGHPITQHLKQQDRRVQEACERGQRRIVNHGHVPQYIGAFQNDRGCE